MEYNKQYYFVIYVSRCLWAKSYISLLKASVVNPQICQRMQMRRSEHKDYICIAYSLGGGGGGRALRCDTGENVEGGGGVRGGKAKTTE